MKIYPVITLHQPWATWIIRGWKTIETRTHNRFKSLYGKTILIHAGQGVDEFAAFNPYLTKAQICQNPDEVISGAILGSAFVHSFGKLNESHAPAALIECKTERYGLVLTNIKAFEKPILISGGQGIWFFDMDTHQKVKKSNFGPLQQWLEF